MSLVDLGKRLLEAAKSGLTDEVRALMSNGAPFTTDWLGTSPLHFASQNGHVDTAEVLLRAGISRDARTKVDRTPLHVASQEGHTDIVELLIRNGADIEAKDMLKMTPLHWAVEKGHVGVIELLFNHGASVHVENKFDKNPVDIAISNARSDIAELLQLQRNNVVEVTTDPSIIEEVTTESAAATETISSLPETVTLMEDPHARVAVSETGTEQSSTAVLATLAALAEATGPLNATNTTSTTAAEALNWLETHGITMISNDNSTIVTSTMETGQHLTLTEAGKLALNFVKDQGEGEGEVEGEVVGVEQEVTEQVITEEEDGTQNVITIVTEQGQLVEEDDQEHMVVLADPAAEETGCGEPDMKKIKLEIVTSDANGVVDHHEEL